MLGRVTACLLAILVTVLLSVKHMGNHEAIRSENSVRYALEKFMSHIEIKGMIELEDVSELNADISRTGMLCDIEIEIGTVIYGRNRNTVEVMYSEEILDELEKVAGAIDLKKRMISVFAIPKSYGLGEKLANILWETYTGPEIIVTGGFIHG